jgi:hypothetical protein
VVLSWMVQQDIIVVPKSESDERQKANITVRPSGPITSSPSADNCANTL